jgi:zinc/manganese transport system substrate-binding protein
MKRIFMLLGLLLFSSEPALAALNVFACEPEWGALAKEIGGDKVEVYSATTALQDPHFIEARPSLLARARNADLMICTGAQLETGWLPIVQAQSGNGKIQPGQPGYVEAASLVSRLEIPSRLDRAEGDVHAAGNPHMHLDPRNIAKVAAVLAQQLARLDGANKETYQARNEEFQKRWTEAIARWEKQGASLRGMRVVTHHRNMTYLYNWLGLVEVGNLEPKPGIPPTPGHLAELLARLQSNPVKAVIRAGYENAKASESLAERAKVPAVVLPYTVGGNEKAKDLFGLFDDTIARLLAANSKG